MGHFPVAVTRILGRPRPQEGALGDRPHERNVLVNGRERLGRCFVKPFVRLLNAASARSSGGVAGVAQAEPAHRGRLFVAALANHVRGAFPGPPGNRVERHVMTFTLGQ